MARARALALGVLGVVMMLGAGGCAVDRQRDIEQRRTAAFDRYAQGERFEQAGAYEEALREYRAAAELSERPGFLYRVGLMHQQLGDAGRAVVFYDRTLELAPDFELATAQREIALATLRREEEALPPPARPPIAEVSPPPPATIDRRQPDPARRPVEVADDPTSPPLPIPTVGTPFELLDPDEVRRVLFPELARPGGFDVEAERERARAAMAAMRWSDAVLAWGRVARAEPDDAEASLELAKAFQRTGRTRRALEEYATAARLAPGSVDVRMAWGNALAESRLRHEAEEQYRAGLALDPDNPRLLNNLGALYLETGRAGEAVGLLRRVVEADPGFVAAHLNLALALDGSGGPVSEAMSSLETYLRLDGPRREEAERWLVRLRSRGIGETPE